MSVNTYCKYLQLSIKAKYVTIDQYGNYHVDRFIDLFEEIYGNTGSFVKINPENCSTFKLTIQEIRKATVLANWRNQSFIIEGDRISNTGRKPKNFFEHKARKYVDNLQHRASKKDKIITSTRQAGRLTGVSFTTGNKVLKELLKDEKVVYVFPQSYTNLPGYNSKEKAAIAETNRPYNNCTYNLGRNGINFHLGRQVFLTDNLPKGSHFTYYS